MPTSRPGKADHASGTIFLDALFAVLIISAAIPAALAAIGGVIRGSASLEEMVREALETERVLEVIYECEDAQ